MQESKPRPLAARRRDDSKQPNRRQPAHAKSVTTDLSIIIVNWNGGMLLRRCIESILRAPPSVSYEIIVVDNASHDNSIALAKESVNRAGFKGLKIIRNADNVGFARANNHALGSTRSELVFLLNPDTEVEPGTIDQLIATLRRDPRVGACGPRILNSDGSVQVSVWRNPTAPWEILVSGFKLDRLMPARIRGNLLLGRHWDHRSRRRVTMLSGAAILVRRAMIDAVGGLDEDFFMYGEDNEWCLRIVRAGWGLVFEPGAVIVHHVGQSSFQRWTPTARGIHMTESWIRCHKKHVSRVHLIANLLARFAVVAAATLNRRLRNRCTAGTRLELALLRRYLREALFSG